MKLVRALFDYTAATREELSFREGDVITVVKEGAEWLEGELAGKRGWLPKTYVEPTQAKVPTRAAGPPPAPPTRPMSPATTPAAPAAPSGARIVVRTAKVVGFEKRQDTMTRGNFTLFIVAINDGAATLFRRLTEFHQVWAKICEQCVTAPPTPPIKETLMTNYSKLASELDQWLALLLTTPQWSSLSSLLEFFCETQRDRAMHKNATPEDSRAAGLLGDVPRDLKVSISRTFKVADWVDRRFEFELHVTRDGVKYTIYRRYSEWLALHETLLEAFPTEAGRVPGAARVIPFMPGKKITGLNGQEVADSRLLAMREYFDALLRLDTRIARHSSVVAFFSKHAKDSDPQFLVHTAQ